MRIILVTILITFFAFSGLANAADEHVAIFKDVAGSVKIIRNHQDIVAVSGSQLMRSDIVVTAPNSSGGIVFKDGTLLTLGSSSEVKINQYVFQPEEAKYDFAVYLSKGSAIYSSGKIGHMSPESVSVGTPRATVGVRGTRFIVQADAK